ncbi:MAG: hypothetical protein J7M29_04770 [Verrucomicrobia bacterium]|nr:hypothetical protein [Verrucomicrobiota bacterium]
MGSINSWGAKPLRQHRLWPKPYRYSFILAPISGDAAQWDRTARALRALAVR